MKLVLATVAATTAASLSLLLSSAPVHRATLAAPVGPGAVIAMHRELFAALDAGDADKAATFVDASKDGGFADGEDGGITRPSVFLPSPAIGGGAPVFAQGVDGTKAALKAFARAGDDGLPAWTTRIVKSRADCYSADVSYAVFEFERTRGVKGGTKRFRSTSLVRHVEGQGWKLFHWHVSPADGPPTALDAR